MASNSSPELVSQSDNPYGANPYAKKVNRDRDREKSHARNRSGNVPRVTSLPGLSPRVDSDTDLTPRRENGGSNSARSTGLDSARSAGNREPKFDFKDTHENQDSPGNSSRHGQRSNNRDWDSSPKDDEKRNNRRGRIGSADLTLPLGDLRVTDGQHSDRSERDRCSDRSDRTTSSRLSQVGGDMAGDGASNHTGSGSLPVVQGIPSLLNLSQSVRRKLSENQEAMSAAATTAAAVDEVETDWSCVRCGHKNPLDLNYCENCASVRNPVSARSGGLRAAVQSSRDSHGHASSNRSGGSGAARTGGGAVGKNRAPREEGRTKLPSPSSIHLTPLAPAPAPATLLHKPQKSSASAPAVPDESGEDWKCRKCGEINTYEAGINFCMVCATVRGATGSRHDSASLYASRFR